MQSKNNLALIATLYNNHSANLYSDIYFPIINFGIATISKNQFDPEKYYDIEFLQSAIDQDFGIKIPLIVLKQALKALVSQQKDITLKLFENGEKFQIIKKWDVYIDTSIDERLSLVMNNFNELDESFRIFIGKNKISTDKSFLEFFSENTNDIFKYLDHLEAIPSINENYYHIANFLIEIKDTNKHLFNLANNTFWASVISAFLKREVDLNIKPEKTIYYYLDSSLVMAILDLDSEINAVYGAELLSVILAAGHIPCVHPLTIKEIDGILQSVERSGPNHGSAIENAYYRRQLNPVEILKIRNSLHKLLSGIKIQVIENTSSTALDEICNRYKNKQAVNSLKQTRGYSNGSIRDIHDIFMCDFIIKKRGDVHEIEKINSSFVSLNSDLIAFIKREYNEKFSPIIHPSNIISDLWLHDPKCTLIKENGLTEMMTRCIALNNTDVRRKLRQLAKYIETDNLSENDYVSVYNSLINRSQKVLKKFASIEDNNKIESDQSRSIVAEIIQVSKIEEEDRIKHIKSIHDQNAAIVNQNKILIAEIESFKKTIADKIESQNIVEQQNTNKEAEIVKLKQEQKRLLQLTNRSKEIDSTINSLERKKESSISMIKYWILLFTEIGAISLFLFSMILYVIKTDNLQKDYVAIFSTLPGIVSLGAFSISILLFILKFRDSTILSFKIKYQSIKEEQIKYWLSNNPNYSELIEERKNIDSKIKSYE
ncbi:coiled-coil domain-containing protein [Parabacteroides sp. FAFU027]|uniref:coiled-coil domain-containing protein n=1 Tax=Parabacteroides sp. FAFU027 TaxID=2922715 RepID=UPI001FAF2E05|nr:hypothetical protein [Parabacteroides sp. FAFU027]